MFEDYKYYCYEMLLKDISYISDKFYIKNVADTISSTILAFVGKEIIDDYPLYRVCIGSFNNKANAITLKNTAISKGFNDAYIIH